MVGLDSLQPEFARSGIGRNHWHQVIKGGTGGVSREWRGLCDKEEVNCTQLRSRFGLLVH